MKNTLLFIIAFLLCIPSLFALEISNANGDEQEFFSISQPTAYVSTTQNLTNFSVNYSIGSTTYEDFISLTSCEEGFCGEVTLTDLIDENNGSFAGSTIFLITAGNQNKTIYLDFQKPTFTLTSDSLNSTKKELTLDFTYSDNSAKIKSVELFSIEGNSSLFLASFKDKNSYVLSLKESGNVTLEFKVTDQAGNIEVKRYTFEIPDLFEPTLNSYMLSKKNDVYSLTYSAQDNKQLKEISISQGTLSISDDLENNKDSGTITLPFSSGEITLELRDDAQNVFSTKISLERSFTLTNLPTYLTSETFSFRSNAQKCILTQIDDSNKNLEFSKSSDSFSRTIDVNSDGTYSLQFTCENNNYKESFQREVILDTKKPTQTTLSIEKIDDGSLELSWEESEDENGVKYILYRDGDDIYDGNSLSYNDDNVNYPNEYTYTLEVKDKAGNDIESNSVSAIPLKTQISFSTPTKDSTVTQKNSYQLSFTTDPQTTITYKISNGGEIINEQTLLSQNGNVNLNLPIGNGDNTIEVSLEDEFGNSLKRTFVVTKEIPVTSTVDNEPTQEISSSNQTLNATTQPTIAKDEKQISNLIWFILFLVLLGIFIYFFIIKESNLKERMKNAMHKRKYSEFSKKRKADAILGHSLKKTRQARIKKQQEQEKEERKKEKEKQKPSSSYHRQKLDEISRRNEVHFPLLSRKKAEKRVKKIRDNKNYDEYIQKESRSFNNKDPQKEQGFNEYLGKVKSTPSWNSSRDYVEKPIPKEEPKQEKQSQQKPQEQPQEKKKFSLFNRGGNSQESNEQSTQEQPQQTRREKISLDEYLSKRTKKKRSYFAERQVERDAREFR